MDSTNGVDGDAIGLPPDLRTVPIHPDHWYPLAWSTAVRRGKTHGVHFAGEPIVLARSSCGTVFALEDRCAHRQVPLHTGVVIGKSIRCGYHGWTYDCHGQCIDIPYLGKERLPNGVRAYPCREAHGMVFVFPGNPALCDQRPIPTLEICADRRYRTRRFGRKVECHYSFMHENLMDMHRQFLRRWKPGGIQIVAWECRGGDGWIEVDYAFARASAATFSRMPVRPMSGTPPADFQQDARDLATVRTQYPYQTLQFRSKADVLMLDLWIAYVPQDASQRVNRAFGVLSIRKPPMPGLLHAVWPLLVKFSDLVFQRNCAIVEQEQLAYDNQGSDLNQELFPVINELRDLLRRCGNQTGSSAS